MSLREDSPAWTGIQSEDRAILTQESDGQWNASASACARSELSVTSCARTGNGHQPSGFENQMHKADTPEGKMQVCYKHRVHALPGWVVRLEEEERCKSRSGSAGFRASYSDQSTPPVGTNVTGYSGEGKVEDDRLSGVDRVTFNPPRIRPKDPCAPPDSQSFRGGFSLEDPYASPASQSLSGSGFRPVSTSASSQLGNQATVSLTPKLNSETPGASEANKAHSGKNVRVVHAELVAQAQDLGVTHGQTKEVTHHGLAATWFSRVHVCGSQCFPPPTAKKVQAGVALTTQLDSSSESSLDEDSDVGALSPYGWDMPPASNSGVIVPDCSGAVFGLCLKDAAQVQEAVRAQALPRLDPRVTDTHGWSPPSEDFSRPSSGLGPDTVLLEDSGDLSRALRFSSLPLDADAVDPARALWSDLDISKVQGPSCCNVAGESSHESLGFSPDLPRRGALSAIMQSPVRSSARFTVMMTIAA